MSVHSVSEFERTTAFSKDKSNVASWLGWFRPRSIGGKLRSLFGYSAMLVVAVAIVASIGFNRIGDQASQLSDLTRVALLTASINSKIYNSQEELGAYRDQGFQIDRLNTAIEHSQTAIDLNSELRSVLTQVDPKLLPRVDAMDGDLAQFKAALVEVGQAPRDDIDRVLRPLYAASYEAGQETILIRERVAEELVAVSQEEKWEINTFLSIMIAASLIALMVVGTGFRFVTSRVANPIQSISQVGKQISDGDRELQVPEVDRDDEIGILARTLSVMQSNSNEMLALQEEAVKATQAELEHQIALEVERKKRDQLLLELANKFELMVRDVTTDVASATVQLEESAFSMAKDAEKSSDESNIAASRLAEAVANVTSVAAASDEFVVSVGEISRQAQKSAERARLANEVAGRANETILTLDASANQVSGIVELISNIAQRTNLLALNASIEAARGGEAGKGFAVVASEVKELATQTARATQDVEQRITDMQSSAVAGVESLRLIVSEITELETSAVAIASTVDQQSVAGQNIVQSVDIAASNTDGVNENVSLVSQLSANTQSAASQVLQSARTLQTQTKTLREQVDNFLNQMRAA